MIRILITGFGEINNKEYIKEFIYKIINIFDGNCIIVGRGKYGDNPKLNIDYLVRKTCRELDIEYEEFTPYYKRKNPFTVKLYNTYKYKELTYMRTKHMIKLSDIIIYFIDSSLYTNITEIKEKKFFYNVKYYKKNIKIKII